MQFANEIEKYTTGMNCRLEYGSPRNDPTFFISRTSVQIHILATLQKTYKTNSTCVVHYYKKPNQYAIVFNLLSASKLTAKHFLTNTFTTIAGLSFHLHFSGL